MVFAYSTRLANQLPYLVNGVRSYFSILATFVVKEVQTIEHGPFDNIMQQTVQVVGPKIYAPVAVQGSYLEDFKKQLIHEKEMNYGSTITGKITLGGITTEYEVVPVIDEAG